MSDSNSKSLREALAADYEGLTRRLARRLGSADFAREALHETFLRVDRVSDAVEVRSPLDYLFQTALNVARDRRRGDQQLLSAAEIETIVDLADEAPDPAAAAESRIEMQEFEKALAELPTRRRDVFIAAHVHQLPHREIADRLGINVRTVDFDLQYAMEHLGQRLGRKVLRRFGPKAKPRACD
ncbi:MULTISPECIES: RNA polymerase sigma factor [unclassified Bradyrhizobium]|uniref:RNA polymerase sigma factor n=1 Tax=unclassified Bradyrhizobium TaxID=2631580 RepID=UPI0028EF3B26|nr:MULTISPECIES: RNA polymerase sigma factor [unclassified Bradyrhizobium]